jgi:hypothetical protein
MMMRALDANLLQHPSTTAPLPCAAVQVDCEPDYEHCSGVVCRLDEFCAAGKFCRPNTCKKRQQYACPADTSPLRSVTCANATFTDCYSSQNFNCSIGTGATHVSCSLKAQTSSGTMPKIWRLSSQVRTPSCVQSHIPGAVSQACSLVRLKLVMSGE